MVKYWRPKPNTATYIRRKQKFFKKCLLVGVEPFDCYDTDYDKKTVLCSMRRTDLTRVSVSGLIASFKVTCVHGILKNIFSQLMRMTKEETQRKPRTIWEETTEPRKTSGDGKAELLITDTTRDFCIYFCFVFVIF